MLSQALSGIAKDLTKMSSKSAIKLVVKDESSLFKWVAFLTGSKNALKGIGFFLGGFLLQYLGFEKALWVMAFALLLILVFALLKIEGELGKAKKKITFKELFSKSAEINILSFARIFLFGARDVWFVVGLPLFFAQTLGWSFDEISLFIASWIIGYGIVQAIVPKIAGTQNTPKGATLGSLIWGGILFLLPVLISIGLFYKPDLAALLLIIGLFVYGIVFAINSSLHSYLIVAFSDEDKVSLSVGFYYMANAIGRFVGTLLSGLIYQQAGLIACLLVSAAMLLIATTSVAFIKVKKVVTSA